MPWAFNINYKEDGKNIMVKDGKKMVPGCIVDWMDTKGYIHHTKAPIYLRGERKFMPRASIYGCFTKANKWKLTAQDEEHADQLRRQHNRVVSYNRKEKQFQKMMDSSPLKSAHKYKSGEEYRKKKLNASNKKILNQEFEERLEKVHEKAKELLNPKKNPNASIYVDSFKRPRIGLAAQRKGTSQIDAFQDLKDKIAEEKILPIHVSEKKIMSTKLIKKKVKRRHKKTTTA